MSRGARRTHRRFHMPTQNPEPAHCVTDLDLQLRLDHNPAYPRARPCHRRHIPVIPRSRAQSIITSGDMPQLRPDDTIASPKSGSTFMGTDHSKQQRPPSRSTTLPPPRAQQNATDALPTDKPQPSPSARPVDVPQSSLSETQTKQFYPSWQPDSGLPYGFPTSKFGRPPRLPLPIEEVYGPGSPIITLQDISSPVGKGDVNGLPRRTSVLSSTTVDDEDVGDKEALLGTDLYDG